MGNFRRTGHSLHEITRFSHGTHGILSLLYLEKYGMRWIIDVCLEKLQCQLWDPMTHHRNFGYWRVLASHGQIFPFMALSYALKVTRLSGNTLNIPTNKKDMLCQESIHTAINNSGRRDDCSLDLQWWEPQLFKEIAPIF